MPIIRGSHSGTSQLSAASSPTESTRGGITAEAVDTLNRSFAYLTIDPNQPDPNALLPSGNPSAVIAALTSLGVAMIEDSDSASANSRIPPVYTYWGQFIDHDITAGTDRPGVVGKDKLLSTDILDPDGFTPVPPASVIGPTGIANLRDPELDLDSVYGGGPSDQLTMAEGIFEPDKLHLAVGDNLNKFPGLTPNPNFLDALKRDLPRKPNRRAKIADDRNDENLLVAQFHTAFLRFHNEVVKAMPGKSFSEVSQTVRWHYQWLIVNDYLRTICMDGIVDQVLFGSNDFFDSSANRFMPLEFSVAAFRFGHSMVRSRYDFNMNFGRGANALLDRAGFRQLFQFTGLKGDLGSEQFGENITTLPNNWIIEWDRLTNKFSPHADRFARKIDTNLAEPLTDIPADNPDGGAEGEATMIPAMTDIARHLAVRNLLRSYLLSIPVGQHVATQLQVAPLSASELIPQDKPKVKAALEANNNLLANKTPLWYYLLREAEVQTGGESLGELGSRLVAGTLIGLLKADPTSYLNVASGWDPSKGVKLGGKPIVRIMDLFQFAGVA